MEIINELPSFEVSLLNPLMDLIDEYFKLEEVQKFLNLHNVPFKEVNSVSKIEVNHINRDLWFIRLYKINGKDVLGTITVASFTISLTLNSYTLFKERNGKLRYVYGSFVKRFCDYLEDFLKPFKPPYVAGFANPRRSFREGTRFSISGDFQKIFIIGKGGYKVGYLRNLSIGKFVKEC